MFSVAPARRSKKSHQAVLQAVKADGTRPELDLMPALGTDANLNGVAEQAAYFAELLDRRLFRLRMALRGTDVTRALIATRALCSTARSIGANDLDALAVSIEPWIRRGEFRRASAALSTIERMVANEQHGLNNRAALATQH